MLISLHFQHDGMIETFKNDQRMLSLSLSRNNIGRERPSLVSNNMLTSLNKQYFDQFRHIFLKALDQIM